MGFPARMPATTSSPWALVRYSPVTTFSPVRGLRVKQTPVAPSSPRLPKTMETTLTAETAVSGILFTRRKKTARSRSEEHTSELQSRQYLVCRLLLEKKKNKNTAHRC